MCASLHINKQLFKNAACVSGIIRKERNFTLTILPVHSADKAWERAAVKQALTQIVQGLSENLAYCCMRLVFRQ